VATVSHETSDGVPTASGGETSVCVEQQADIRLRAKVRWWWRIWLISMVVLSLGHLLCRWYPVSLGPPSPRLEMLAGIGFLSGLMVLLVGLASLIVVPISPVLIWRSAGRLRMQYVRLLGVGLIVAALLVGNHWIQRNIRRNAFEQLANRSAPMVAAIARYEQDHGRPPNSLGDLVPGYLSSYPRTGMRAYPEYRYRVLEQSYVYYDLGKHGQICVRPGICMGSSDRALLWVYYDGKDRVARVRTERMPPLPGFRFFDQSRWKQNPEDRVAMVRDLVGSRFLIGKSQTELTRLLGRPKGRRRLSNEPWELRIDCSSGFSFDSFFYWPSKRYDRTEGGYAERIGDWAFMWD